MDARELEEKILPMRLILKLFISLACFLMTGCESLRPTENNYSKISAPIANPIPLTAEVLRMARDAGLGQPQAQIPGLDGKGRLYASWTPQPNVRQSPTFVVLHGGHGWGSWDFETARLLRQKYSANILVLDSYASRGELNNWNRFGKGLGANTRMFDVVAAGRWLIHQGTDPQKTYLIGGSQGGWAILRALTDELEIKEMVKPLVRAGIAVYPVCQSWFKRQGATEIEMPNLAPYHSPVILFSGGKDADRPANDCEPKVTKEVFKWIEFADATHAWDLPNRGVGKKAIDGECQKSGSGVFTMCRNDQYTEAMYTQIDAFLKSHGL